MTTLDELFADLIRKKAAERSAKDARVAAEEALIAQLAERPERGTAKLEGTMVRAAVKFGLNYKANVDMIMSLDSEFLPLKRVEACYEFDATAYEALREGDPETFRKVAAFVTTTPVKPSVELKL